MLLYEECTVERLVSDHGIGGRKILIVEDDRSLLLVFDRLLQAIDPGLGYDWCTSASDACHALGQGSYGMVLADFMLQGEGNGLDVWEYCREKRPGLEFVMMSGLKLESFCKLAAPGDGLSFLPKPLNLREARAVIEEALEG